MSSYYQDTDTQIVFPIKDFELIDPSPVDETTADNIYGEYIPFNKEFNIIDYAWDVIEKKDNKDISQRAKVTLLQIQSIYNEIKQSCSYLVFIPKLRAFLPDDGSILIEWILNDYRLGFTIEPKKEESGWYLITNDKFGSINAYGYLKERNNKPLLVWLLNFVISHS